MAHMRRLLLVAASALLAACTATEPLESSRGTALRIVDDVDALEAAMDQAEEHCERYDRHAVLQSVSPVDRDELLATFDCGEFDRTAVLQSVGEIDDRRVAAFNCVRT